MALRTSLPLLVLVLSSCGSSGPPIDVGSSSPIDIAIAFVPVGDGSTFTAQLNGQNYASPGQSTIRLAPGTYQVVGSLLGSGLQVGFQTLGSSGGVQSGSPRSVAGPAPQVTSCGITYTSSDKTASQSFQLTFQITSDAKSACGGGPP